MKGCNFFYEFIKEIDQTQIDGIIKFYTQYKVDFRKIYEFLVLPFDREHSINLEELINLIEQQQIYIQKGQLMLLMIKLINLNFILKEFDISQSVFDELSNIWIINTSNFHPHNQSHNYKIVPVNLQLVQQQNNSANINTSIMKLLEKLSSKIFNKKKFYKKWQQYVKFDFDEKLSKFSLYLQKRIDSKTQQKVQTGLLNYLKSNYDEKPYQAKFNIQSLKDLLNQNLQRYTFISNIVLRQTMEHQVNYPIVKYKVEELSQQCDSSFKNLEQQIENLQQNSSQLFRFDQHIKKLKDKIPVYKEYHKILLTFKIKTLCQQDLLPQIIKEIFQKIRKDYNLFLQEELRQIIQIVLV